MINLNILYAFILISLTAPLTFAAKEDASAVPTAIDGVKMEKIKNEYLTNLVAKQKVLILDFSTALSTEGAKLQVHDLKFNKVVGKDSMTTPNSCRRFASIQEPGRNVRGLYCFSGQGKGDSLQIYKGKGKFLPVLKTPKAISAVAGGSNRIFFLSGDAIYLMGQGDKIRPIFVSPFLTGVKAMAFDGETDILYLSTEKEIYSLRTGTLDLLVQNLGGDLAWINSDLIVTNPNGAYRLGSLRDVLVVKK